MFVCGSFVLYAKLPEAKFEPTLNAQSVYACKVTLRDEHRECWLGKVAEIS